MYKTDGSTDAQLLEASREEKKEKKRTRRGAKRGQVKDKRRGQVERHNEDQQRTCR